MTIAEVSKKYSLSQDTLRYYEKIGLIPNVDRTPSGKRDYSTDACEWVEHIKIMRQAGISIESLCQYITLFEAGNSTITERKELLTKEREKLLAKMQDMNETLERLNAKIELYVEAEKNGKMPWD